MSSTRSGRNLEPQYKLGLTTRVSIKVLRIARLRGTVHPSHADSSARRSPSGIPLKAAVLSFLDRTRSASSIDACAAARAARYLSLIHISEPTRRTPISYAVF